MRSSSYFKTISLILILLFGSGCVIPFVIPTSADHYVEIDKVLSQLKVGVTTREEVISILGKPDFIRENYILYREREYAGGAHVGVIIFLVVTGGGGSSKEGQVFMDFLFEFDNYGTLIDYQVDKYDRHLRPIKEVTGKGECVLNCNSKYNSCVNSTSDRSISKPQCEEAKQACSRKCEDSYELKCDPGMESCD